MTTAGANPTLPPREPYSLRLRDHERRLIQTAALSRGQRMAEYIRDAAKQAAREDLTR